MLAAAGSVSVVFAGCVTNDGTLAPRNDATDANDAPGETPGSSSSPTDTDDEEHPTPEESDTPTDDGSTATPGQPVVTDRSFTVTDQRCGGGDNHARISYAEDRVLVEGTIRGSNTCYTAEQTGASYDGTADELTVTIRSYEEASNGVCSMCLVDIDYESRTSFDQGLPDSVVVVHNGQTVASKERSS